MRVPSVRLTSASSRANSESRLQLRMEIAIGLHSLNKIHELLLSTICVARVVFFLQEATLNGRELPGNFTALRCMAPGRM